MYTFIILFYLIFTRVMVTYMMNFFKRAYTHKYIRSFKQILHLFTLNFGPFGHCYICAVLVILSAKIFNISAFL